MFAIILFALIGEIFSCLLAYPYGWPAMILAYIGGGTIFPVVGALLCYGRHTGDDRSTGSADSSARGLSATNPIAPEASLLANDAMLRGSHNLHSCYFDQTKSS